ncbi:hypothetical protein [Rhodococcus rhodochrous]|uniref:Transposase n=1 Tax=Rhodococcus rhodochrous TaxID=1829 RepID=A0AA46WTA9_RHORH|nr:hypothetical protein [Rhodococcus rhodochrous]MCR8693743.1 hypothetical protein [Rhodococcus pyridinivorans]UZF43953.1 hypothetical protein KUM34_019035 [Rhodococcus rhodochrous]
MAFKYDIVRQWDQCVERGAKIRLLREHNLDPNTVRAWVRARDEGHFSQAMLKAAERSKARMNSQERAELGMLRKKVEQLEAKVAQAEAAQDILGKAFELLQGINKTSIDDPSSVPTALMSADEYLRWLGRNNMS